MEKGVDLKDAYQEQQRLLKGKEVKTIFDVGAADGRTGVRYGELFPGANVFSFEPLPNSFAKVKENEQKYDYLTGVNLAMSDKVGTTQFHLTNLKDASSILSPNKTGSSFDRHLELKQVIEVNTTTLDSFCQEKNIDRINVLKF
ncbi:MAG: FkbM family methyltransferase, partial [Bacteroidota bacterium]